MPSSAIRPGSSSIINEQVLQTLRNGDTAGFINSLAGNIQSNVRNSENLFFQITA